jgi:hypothetical protein
MLLGAFPLQARRLRQWRRTYIQENAMNEQRDQDSTGIKRATPANPIDIPEKAGEPDADRTVEGTVPSAAEEAAEPLEESTFTSEHDISRDHAEPTDVTGTTGDNAIDGEYIDVGGGD